MNKNSFFKPKKPAILGFLFVLITAKLPKFSGCAHFKGG